MLTKKDEDSWRHEENARILMRAEEIKANTKDYSGAKKVLAAQQAAISKVVTPTKPATRKK
jgi:hypothetical protein